MDVVIVWSWDSGQHSPAIVFSQTLEAWAPTFWGGGGFEKRRSRKGEAILAAPYQTTKQTVAPLAETLCFGKNMTSCHVSNSWKMVRRSSFHDNWLFLSQDSLNYLTVWRSSPQIAPFSGYASAWLDSLPRYADDPEIYITVSKARKGGHHLCNYLLSDIEEGECSERNASF